jgi:hypothetical protein
MPYNKFVRYRLLEIPKQVVTKERKSTDFVHTIPSVEYALDAPSPPPPAIHTDPFHATE